MVPQRFWHIARKVKDIVIPRLNVRNFYHERVLFYERMDKGKTGDYIIFLGDSLTYEGAWSEFFSDKKILNRGIPGDTIKGIAARVGEVAEIKPQKLFLQCGINDFGLLNKSKEMLVEDYKNLLQKITELFPRTTIFVQSLLPISNMSNCYFPGSKVQLNSDIVFANKELKSFCTQNNIEFIDLHSLFIFNGELNPMYTADGLHLTYEGYEKWIDRIKAIVER